MAVAALDRQGSGLFWPVCEATEKETQTHEVFCTNKEEGDFKDTSLKAKFKNNRLTVALFPLLFFAT